MIILICISILILIICPIIYTKNTGARSNQNINPMEIKKSTGTSTCLSEKVNCKTNDDCKQECIESDTVEFECVEMKRYNSDQINKYGSTESVCAPKKAERNCNPRYGGVLTWNAFPEIDKMSWTCSCTYPNYAAGPGCNLNPDVCEGGTYNWDVTSNDPNISNPENVTCACPADKQTIYGLQTGIPKCIPNSLSPNFNNKSTQTFYFDEYSPFAFKTNQEYRFQEVE